MVPLDHVLALAVLIAPADSAESKSLQDHSYLWQTIRTVAVAIEVLDPREERYVLARRADFDTDMQLIRGRHVELGDAPPILDAWRFPNREMACQLLSINREHHRRLSLKKQLLGGHYGFDEALAETDRRYKIWDAVRDARSEFYYISVRRQALALLRQMIGANAFHHALLPPPIPCELVQPD